MKLVLIHSTSVDINKYIHPFREFSQIYFILSIWYNTGRTSIEICILPPVWVYLKLFKWKETWGKAREVEVRQIFWSNQTSNYKNSRWFQFIYPVINLYQTNASNYSILGTFSRNHHFSTRVRLIWTILNIELEISTLQ